MSSKSRILRRTLSDEVRRTILREAETRYASSSFGAS